MIYDRHSSQVLSSQDIEKSDGGEIIIQMGEVIQETVSGKKEAERLSENSSKPRIHKWVRLGKSQEFREIGSSFFYISQSKSGV